MTREFKLFGRSKNEQQTHFFKKNSPLFLMDLSPLAHTPKQGQVVPRGVGYGIVHFKTRGKRERIGKSSGRSDFWHHFGGQALVIIGGWYSRQPLTNLLANPNIACEQALLFGQAKQASRERASEGPRFRRSLARSSETRFTRPNGRACSQANPNNPRNRYPERLYAFSL